MAFDGSFQAPEDNLTPDLAVDTLTGMLSGLDGSRRQLGDAHPQVVAIDTFFDESLDRFGVEFLVDLAQRRDPAIDHLGFFDAVRPGGRLWDRREVFGKLGVIEAFTLNVDIEVLAWHTQPGTFRRNQFNEHTQTLIPESPIGRIKAYGIPEWAIDANAPTSTSRVVLSALHEETLPTRAVGCNFAELGGVAPFLVLYGSDLDLRRRLSDRYSDVQDEVMQWHQVALAFGDDLARAGTTDATTAQEWVEIVLLDHALTFEMRGDRPEPLTVFAPDVSPDAKRELWIALDRAVTHGRSTFGTHAEWSEHFVEMRTVDGELKISPLDMRLLGLPRAAEIIGADQDFDKPCKVSRAEFGRMCVHVSRFLAALENVPAQSKDGKPIKLTREEWIAANNVLSMVESASPPLYATASRQLGSYLVGRLDSAIKAR